jgi:hypothetical protein
VLWRRREEAVTCTIRQHTPAYVSMRQHTGAVASPRGSCYLHPHTPAYVSIRHHTPAYVSIRHHTSAYVSIRQHTSAYVNIRQHTSAYAMRQHTSAPTSAYAMALRKLFFFLVTNDRVGLDFSVRLYAIGNWYADVC